MAIFIPSIMFEAMRNKIGNIVFLDGNGGPAIRQLVTPANPQSARQVSARLIVAQISQAWRDTLTDSQRDGWDTLGAATPEVNELGKDVQISGIAAYIRTNVSLLQFGIARIDDAPANMDVSTLTVTAVDFEVTANVITYTVPAGLLATDNMYVRYTPPHSPGRTSVKSLLRLLTEDVQVMVPAGAVFDQTVDTDQPINVLADTRTATFQLLNTLNGALSLEQEFKQDVVA